MKKVANELVKVAELLVGDEESVTAKPNMKRVLTVLKDIIHKINMFGVKDSDDKIKKIKVINEMKKKRNKLRGETKEMYQKVIDALEMEYKKHDYELAIPKMAAVINGKT